MTIDQTTTMAPVETSLIRNDDSNPQQGTESIADVSNKAENLEKKSTRLALTIPPTVKDSRKLFVGGLPPDSKYEIIGRIHGSSMSITSSHRNLVRLVTNDEFVSFFSQFGPLIDGVVMFDRETGRSRGFGFVTFQDAEVARVLLMKGNEGKDPSDAFSYVGSMDMRGKKIEIKSAQPKESSSRARNGLRASANIVHNESAMTYDGYPAEMYYYPYQMYSGYPYAMYHMDYASMMAPSYGYYGQVHAPEG